MSPNLVKHLVILGLCAVVAVFAGYFLADADAFNLILTAYGVVALFVITAPGFAPLIAIGLLSPFFLPLPYIYNLPFLSIILMVCCLKLFLWRAMSRRNLPKSVHCFTLPILLFIGWVGLRYLMKPALPNVAGFGSSVSGFRSYLNYGLCFAICFLLPYMLSKREDLFKMTKWMAIISLFFVLLLTPMVFTRSMTVAQWLSQFGMFVTVFDNGMLRFVALPSFGIVLIGLAMLPRLMPLGLVYRVAFAVMGLAAVVLGGGRGGVVVMIAVVLSIILLQRRYITFLSMGAAVAMMLVGFYYIGEHVSTSGGVGVMRILSLTSQRIATQTDAIGTAAWREVRWRRAVEEIRHNPLFGKGYGGLENAWILGSAAQTEEIILEIDMASGGIHNGYLTSAYSLGIPALALFLLVFANTTLLNVRQSRRLNKADPRLSELHIFVGANLVGLAFSILVGTDINAPIIWFYLALGILAERMYAAAAEAKAQQAAATEESALTASPSVA